jgi:hypothetical protein
MFDEYMVLVFGNCLVLVFVLAFSAYFLEKAVRDFPNRRSEVFSGLSFLNFQVDRSQCSLDFRQCIGSCSVPSYFC